MTHFSAAQRRLVILGRARQALGVPSFSRTAAFLLDAMAALPRKSDPDGAASLPWQTIALPRGGAIRANWEGSSSSHDPFFSRTAAFLLDAMAALPRKWVKPEVDPPRFYALPRALKTKGSSVAFFAPLRAGSLARCAL